MGLRTLLGRTSSRFGSSSEQPIDDDVPANGSFSSCRQPGAPAAKSDDNSGASFPPFVGKTMKFPTRKSSMRKSKRKSKKNKNKNKMDCRDDYDCDDCERVLQPTNRSGNSFLRSSSKSSYRIEYNRSLLSASRTQSMLIKDGDEDNGSYPPSSALSNKSGNNVIKGRDPSLRRKKVTIVVPTFDDDDRDRDRNRDRGSDRESDRDRDRDRDRDYDYDRDRDCNDDEEDENENEDEDDHNGHDDDDMTSCSSGSDCSSSVGSTPPHHTNADLEAFASKVSAMREASGYREAIGIESVFGGGQGLCCAALPMPLTIYEEDDYAEVLELYSQQGSKGEEDYYDDDDDDDDEPRQGYSVDEESQQGEPREEEKPEQEPDEDEDERDDEQYHENENENEHGENDDRVGCPPEEECHDVVASKQEPSHLVRTNSPIQQPQRPPTKRAVVRSLVEQRRRNRRRLLLRDSVDDDTVASMASIMDTRKKYQAFNILANRRNLLGSRATIRSPPRPVTAQQSIVHPSSTGLGTEDPGENDARNAAEGTAAAVSTEEKEKEEPGASEPRSTEQSEKARESDNNGTGDTGSLSSTPVSSAPPPDPTSSSTPLTESLLPQPDAVFEVTGSHCPAPKRRKRRWRWLFRKKKKVGYLL